MHVIFWAACLSAEKLNHAGHNSMVMSFNYLQVIKDLRSLIGDHDLDHFFHNRELIVIITENDCDLFNFFFPRS